MSSAHHWLTWRRTSTSSVSSLSVSPSFWMEIFFCCNFFSWPFTSRKIIFKIPYFFHNKTNFTHFPVFFQTHKGPSSQFNVILAYISLHLPFHNKLHTPEVWQVAVSFPQDNKPAQQSMDSTRKYWLWKFFGPGHQRRFCGTAQRNWEWPGQASPSRPEPDASLSGSSVLKLCTKDRTMGPVQNDKSLTYKKNNNNKK